MKSTLIRTLAVLTLATCMSAFAAPVNSSENEAAKCNASPNQTTKQESQKAKKNQDKTKKSPKESQQEEFDRALLGIHG